MRVALDDRRLADRPLGEPGLSRHARCSKAKRKLAQDLLWFCRLTDEDGHGHEPAGSKHGRALEPARGEADDARPDARSSCAGPAPSSTCGLVPGTRWLGGLERTHERRAASRRTCRPRRRSRAPTPPAPSGTFRCTFPLSFRGRLIEGLTRRVPRRQARPARGDSEADRDFVAGYIDSDPKGNGRRLGEVALVDATSRIGQSGRIYYNTLLDENAAAHIAFGSGFGGTRTIKPARGLNRSPTHLDVMIGSPEFEATGVNAKGKRIPLIRDGLWQI